MAVQSQCILLAIQGGGPWSENLTPCLLCISGAVLSHCIMMAVHGGGTWSENLTCLFCISVVKTQCKPVKTYSVLVRNMVALVQCG